MRFSTLGFFHQTIPHGSLIHGLTPFCIWLRIRKVIRQSRCLSGVNDTAGDASADSAMQTWFKTAGVWDLEFERLWLPLKGISLTPLVTKSAI
jgi:hypothetical protein